MRDGVDATHYFRNFLNHLDPKTEIYKYILVRHIVEMKRSRRLRFYQVNSWDDVYENYFLKQHFTLENGTPVNAAEVSQRIYGQCWTQQKESDAMWRIYSPHKDAVKVKTTAEKLMDVLYVTDRCMATTFIGLVDYLPQHKIEAEYCNLADNRISISSFGGHGINNFIKESLITKREEFAHEKEIRIINMADGDSEPLQYIEMPFDPDSFFDEFIIDPRASVAEEQSIRETFAGNGIDLNKIEKSHLYDLNTYTLIM